METIIPSSERVDRSQSLCYFAPQDSPSKAGSAGEMVFGVVFTGYAVSTLEIW